MSSPLLLGPERSATADGVSASSPAVEWVERNTARALSDELARCVDVLCAVEQPHNLPLIGDGWQTAVDYDVSASYHGDRYECPEPLPPVEFGVGWMLVRIRGELATYDSSGLTRLVLAAHEHAVRVAIRSTVTLVVDSDSYVCEYIDGKWVETDEHPAERTNCLELQLNARSRSESFFEHHPRLGEAVATAARS